MTITRDQARGLNKRVKALVAAEVAWALKDFASNTEEDIARLLNDLELARKRYERKISELRLDDGRRLPHQMM